MFNIVVMQSKGTKILILHNFVGKWTQILIIGYMSGNATLDDYFVADVKQWAWGLFWATNVYFMILLKKSAKLPYLVNLAIMPWMCNPKNVANLLLVWDRALL